MRDEAGNASFVIENAKRVVLLIAEVKVLWVGMRLKGRGVGKVEGDDY